MALSNAPHPVPNRHAMIGPAGMNDSPAILARHNGLVIHPAAHKEARIYLDHTITAFVSTSSLSTSTSPEISFGNSRSRVLRRFAFLTIRFSICLQIGTSISLNRRLVVAPGTAIDSFRNVALLISLNVAPDARLIIFSLFSASQK